MTRTVDCWYKRKENNEFTETEKESILCIGSGGLDEVLVVQYHHKRTDKRWLTVQGFIVERSATAGYGLSRTYTPAEKKEIEENILKMDSLEGKVHFDEGGTRIV